MSGKKSDNLRNAMAALKVNEPLRLSKNGPGLKPPESSQKNTEEVPRNEVPPPEQSHSESPQKKVAQNEYPQSELPRNEVAAFEAPQKERAGSPKKAEMSRVSDSPQNEQPRNEPARNEVSQNEIARSEHPQLECPKNEVAQNAASQLEAPKIEGAQAEFPQIEVPQNEGPQFERSHDRKPRGEARLNGPPSGGSFFRLSDRAFSSPLLQQISGDCFRLFLWMSSRAWRYVKSEGTLRASIGFIEQGTCMSHATISRCIKTLRDEGLITLLETDYKRGNVWQVSPVAFAGSGPTDLPPRFEAPQNGRAQIEGVAPSKRGGSALNSRGKPPQNEVEIRSLKKIQEISSQEGTLFARIEKIRTAEKQKSERECLDKLLESYSPAELEMAVSFLEKNGVLGSRQPCHNLFRYLVSAADDVLKAVQRQQPIAVATRTSDESEYESKARAQAALTAFESQLSAEERETFISSYVEREYTWGYIPSKSLLTRLAADRWYSQQEEQLHARAC